MDYNYNYGVVFLTCGVDVYRNGQKKCFFTTATAELPMTMAYGVED